MPATYAHYLFGEKVAKKLTGGAAENGGTASTDGIAGIIQGNKQLFYIGLHGPDILFFYKPIKHNEISAQGYAMHDKPASEIFKRAGDMLKLTADKGAAMAYLFGFVCHFALDHACHPYIEKKIEVSHLAHSEIENEFDRYLINYNGKEVKHTDLCAHIVASYENAAVIAPFFTDVTVKQIKKAVKSMKFYNKFLIGNRAYKRGIVKTCLHLSGNYGKLKGNMMYKYPIPQCEDSNKRLFELFTGAVDGCVSLIMSYANFLEGKGELDGTFNFTFGAGDKWQDIEM